MEPAMDRGRGASGDGPDDRERRFDAFDGRRPGWVDRLGVDRLAWGFVALGAAIRLGRYLGRFPLWGDEAMVAVNLLDRGYLGLLGDLDYMQICPLLFLWAERAAVDLLGFHEYSLRLVPVVCSVAGLVAFRQMAGRLLGGLTMLIAVGLFAVSLPLVRFGVEAKPYAGDLVVSVGLLAMAVEARRASRMAPWLWAMTACAPVAIGLSHPGAFAAGGVSLGLLGRVRSSGDWKDRVAFVGYNAALVASFGAVYLLHTGQQSHQALETLREGCWSASFPPTDGPVALLRWLVLTNTSDLFSYPAGGTEGGSALTTLAVATAVVVLCRRGRAGVAGLMLGPFAMTMLASAIGRYPYGGTARCFQHLGPPICLLGGLGFAWWLARLGPGPRGRRASTLCLVALAGFGVGHLVVDLARPYRTRREHRSRELARAFWAEQGRDARVVWLRGDLGLNIRLRDVGVPRLALFECNRAIYAADRLDGGADRLVRCVVFNEPTAGHPLFDAWYAAMCRRFEHRATLSVAQRVGPEPGVGSGERYDVFEFEVRPADRHRVEAELEEATLPVRRLAAVGRRRAAGAGPVVR